MWLVVELSGVLLMATCGALLLRYSVVFDRNPSGRIACATECPSALAALLDLGIASRRLGSIRGHLFPLKGESSRIARQGWANRMSLCGRAVDGPHPIAERRASVFHGARFSGAIALHGNRSASGKRIVDASRAKQDLVADTFTCQPAAVLMPADLPREPACLEPAQAKVTARHSQLIPI
jgi:hypothetical protein